MSNWLEVYGNRQTNTSPIQAGESFVFCQELADREAKNRHLSSFNTLFVTSASSQEITILLDGYKQEAVLLGSGAFSFKADEGIYYDFVEIKNNGSSQIEANDINVRYGISKERTEKTIKTSELLPR